MLDEVVFEPPALCVCVCVCVTNYCAVCDLGISLAVNPFSLSKLSSVSLLSPLSGHLKGLSVPSLAFSGVLGHQTFYSRCHCFYLQLIDYILLFFVHTFCHYYIFSLLAYLHCNINSKLSSMLSTCLCPPSVCLLAPSLPPVLVSSSLQREPQRDREAQAKQDDGLHHGIVRHGAHLQRSGPQTRQTDHPENGRVSYEIPEGEWEYQLGWVIQALLSHRPGTSKPGNEEDPVEI